MFGTFVDMNEKATCRALPVLVLVCYRKLKRFVNLVASFVCAVAARAARRCPHQFVVHPRVTRYRKNLLLFFLQKLAVGEDGGGDEAPGVERRGDPQRHQGVAAQNGLHTARFTHRTVYTQNGLHTLSSTGVTAPTILTHTLAHPTSTSSASSVSCVAHPVMSMARYMDASAKMKWKKL
jgi:hypothetical protein